MNPPPWAAAAALAAVTCLTLIATPPAAAAWFRRRRVARALRLLNDWGRQGPLTDAQATRVTRMLKP